jgi:hypothetical protein
MAGRGRCLTAFLRAMRFGTTLAFPVIAVIEGSVKRGIAVKGTISYAKSGYPMLEEWRGVELTERVMIESTDGADAAEGGRGTVVERRQHPRGGIVRELENITYTALRRYGFIGEVAQQGFTETALG